MKRRCVVLGILAVVLFGSAVEAGGESLFSSLGLGETRLPTTTRGRGMGGTGVALPDTVSSSFLNPATASLLRRVTLSVVYEPEIRLPAGPEGASRNWDARLSALKLIFPFPRGVALSAGLLLRGDMTSEASWVGRTVTADYVGGYRREGGIFCVPVHVSVSVRDRLLLAGGLDLTQASSRESWSKEFSESNYQDAEDILEGEFSGARASGALLLLWPGKASVGIVACRGGDLDGTLSTLPVHGVETRTDASLHMPAEYGVGFSYHPRPGWTLALEGWRTRWGDLRIAGISPYSDRTSHRFAVGIERASARRGGSRWARLPLRMGYWREPQAFEFPEGKRVIAQMATLGTGFPLTGRGGWLDLAVEVGRIGDGSINGAQEKVVRFSISVTASERWQRKRQTRY